ncbi:MAG: hypothetical protein Q8O67_19115 [Deltaproteobacteria bacterium]|nr:hypothetical protein [Deltaproteobacteria bacterium]
MRSPSFFLVCGMVAAGVAHADARQDKATAALLSDVVTTALSHEARFEVMASADVRRQLELEANKQMVGCSEGASSCLAEVAGALGARVVVYGRLGRLEDDTVLTLNLFDSNTASAAGRVVVKDRSASALADKIEPALADATARFLASVPGTDRVKVLVLELETGAAEEAAAVVAPPPVPADPPNFLFIGGIGGIGLGLAGVVVGGVFLANASAEHTAALVKTQPLDQAEAHYDDRDRAANLAGLVGGAGVVVVVAGGLAVFFAVQE